MKKNPNILYIDNHLVVVSKLAGMLVQGDITGDETLLQITKDFIKEKYSKPGEVYLGLVHRLDRPTSGVICFAKTSKAAARLSKQFKNKSIKKNYIALVQGKVPESGTWIDNIDRKEKNSYIAKNGKIAELSFERIAYKDKYSLVKIDLKTGRHHQIRVQFAHRGFFVLGDFRYGSKIKFPNKSIGLHAYSLTLSHPTKKDNMTFVSSPGDNWPEYFREKAKELIDS